MSEEKNENVQAAQLTTESTNDRVDIYIPRGDANDDPNLLVGVNGVNYLLPRGKTSKVPKCVAEEVKRSWRAQEAKDEKNDQMLAAAQDQA